MRSNGCLVTLYAFIFVPERFSQTPNGRIDNGKFFIFWYYIFHIPQKRKLKTPSNKCSPPPKTGEFEKNVPRKKNGENFPDKYRISVNLKKKPPELIHVFFQRELCSICSFSDIYRKNPRKNYE